MSERFTISDTHFGHEKTCTTFKQTDGVTPLRPFANAQEMDEELVKRWNSVVKPYDKVYVLGDVVIARRNLVTVGRLNGKKRLIMGNHDIFPVQDYLVYFEKVSGYQVWHDMIMSHIPIHEESLKQRWLANVHGHLHANRVMRTNPKTNREEIHPRYLNVSVEQTDFTPISFDEVRARIKQQREQYGDD